MKRIILAVCLVCLIFPGIVYAEPGSRPKIGLVLGGGGARGAAHTGVLKVLEANNIPIDIIVGTSMGSIVGGLYAAGYSPGEIDFLFKEIDWRDMFSDRPKENMLSFRDKKTSQRLASFEFGVKGGGIKLPRGIVPGQKLGFMLQKLTLHTVDNKSFDELRIPFRAVATDAVTGELYVFNKGNLGEAIRASMSVPGAFPPVEIGDRLLIDGFLAKNVPIEVAKDLGADIIIAVSVDADLAPKEKLNSALDITNQMIAILSRQNVQHSLALLTDRDVLIRPDLGDMSSADFVDAPEAIDKGETAALAVLEDIRRYSVSKQEYDVFLANQRVKEEKSFTIDFIDVPEPKRVNVQMIKGRIKSKPGQPLDFDQLEQDLTNIYAIGDFETVDFEVAEKNGKKGLIINTKEKNWGPNYLRFGLNLISDSEGANDYNFLLDYRRTQMNSLGAEWKIVGQIGQTQGLFTEFYQPLDAENYFFVAPQLLYEQHLQDVYEDERRIAEYKVDEIGGGFDFGVNLSSYVEVRLGVRSSVIDAKPEVGSTSLPKFDNINKSGVVAKVDFDQFDNHRFPTKGIRGEAKLFLSDEWLGAGQNYKKLDFFFGKATSIGEKNILLYILDGGISLDDKTPFYDEYTLGGFLSLSGLGKDQLRAKNKGTAKLIYYYKMADMMGLASKIYLGCSLEAGGVWADKDDFGEDLIWGGSAFLGVDTVLGPLYIAYGHAEGNDGKLYLFLGKTF